jgi:methionyl-tRNA synthetase
MISVEEFHTVEMKIGTIVAAEVVPDADKLLRLTVDFGEGEPRQIVSGIRASYAPDDLVGKQCPFVVNLPPRTIKGLESKGMILALKSPDGEFALLHPDKPVPSGAALG